MILLIDNYDSFTYNLYHQIGMLMGEACLVVRNDEMTLSDIEVLKPEGIVLSPGPGHPSEAGICIEIIQKFYKTIPILGVCLGHQAIAVAFGGIVSPAECMMHGKASHIDLNGLSFSVARYHSLIVQKQKFPDVLKIEAEDELGQIMAMKHKEHAVFGLQFHPESILTPSGNQILEPFLKEVREVKKR